MKEPKDTDQFMVDVYYGRHYHYPGCLATVKPTGVVPADAGYVRLSYSEIRRLTTKSGGRFEPDPGCIKSITRGRIRVGSSDIREWLDRNATALLPGTILTSSELDHVEMCMDHLYRHYTEGYPVGGFLTAVVNNDLREACVRADDVNRKALYLYVLFIASKVPFRTVEKAKEAGVAKS